MLAVFVGSDGSDVLSLLADDDMVTKCVSGLIVYVALQGEGDLEGGFRLAKSAKGC